MVVGGEGRLERIAIAASNEDDTPGLLFLSGSGGEEIIRLEARLFRILKATGGNEFRQRLELLDHGVVEFATTLIGRKLLMPIGWTFNVSHATSTARGCSSR